MGTPSVCDSAALSDLCPLEGVEALIFLPCLAQGLRHGRGPGFME